MPVGAIAQQGEVGSNADALICFAKQNADAGDRLVSVVVPDFLTAVMHEHAWGAHHEQTQSLPNVGNRLLPRPALRVP